MWGEVSDIEGPCRGVHRGHHSFLRQLQRLLRSRHLLLGGGDGLLALGDERNLLRLSLFGVERLSSGTFHPLIRLVPFAFVNEGLTEV